MKDRWKLTLFALAAVNGLMALLEYVAGDYVYMIASVIAALGCLALGIRHRTSKP